MTHHRSPRTRHAAAATEPAARRAHVLLLARLVLLLVLALLVRPAPAAAHTDLLASSPAAGETVSVDTGELMLSFADEVVPGSARVSVVDADGAEVARTLVVVEGALVRVGLRLSTPGAHEVGYRVVAADGHVVTGTLRFTVATGPAGEVPAPLQVPPAPEPSGIGRFTPATWAALTGTLVAVLVGLHAARRRRASVEVAVTAPAQPDGSGATGAPDRDAVAAGR